MSSNRTEKTSSLSVVPSGWTVITSDRLANPSNPNALVGFDLRMPRVGPGWLGETQLYVELPSQGIFNVYVGRHDLSEFRPDEFSRVSYTLPPDIVSKLGKAFDDLRFKIVLNTPLDSGPYLLDRFRFGGVKEPTETIELALPVPRNVGPSNLLLVATEALTLGPGVRIEPGIDPLVAVASLGSGGVSLGAGSEVDSVVSYGPVSVGANAHVRGYIGGASQLSVDASALIWGEVTSERAPLTSSTFRTSFGPTTTDVFVGAESSRVLAPGRYRDVEVAGGALVLEPGSYTIDRLTVAPAGSVEYDSRQGVPFVAVRTAMQLRGGAHDRASDAGGAPFGAPTWAYMGADSLEFSGTPPGRLVAPSAGVRVTLPPTTFSGSTLWSVAGRRIDIQADPGGSNALRPVPPRSPLPPLREPSVTVSDPPPAAVSMNADGVSAHEAKTSSQEGPVDVFSDNPWWHGAFNWKQTDESAIDGCPPWFIGGEWGRFVATTLTMWRLRPEEPPAQAWSAALLPGNFLHARFPQFAPSCAEQSPETSPQGFFTTRAFNLWHGATFRIVPTIQHASSVFSFPPEDLFVRLSPEALVVPVVVIHWDGEAFLDDVAAMFDFVPSAEHPADIVPPVRPPPAPYTSPDAMDFPPDEVWKRCGIQFQIVRALHLGPPELRPRATSAVCEGNACCSDEAAQDYVSNAELSRRLHDALGAEFDAIFGAEGLKPILVQYGRPAIGRCGDNPSSYVGKTSIEVRTFADVHTDGMIQINIARPYVTAHELAHRLLSEAGHPTDDTQRLIHKVSDGSLLLPDECNRATGVAANLSGRYFEYNRRRGLTDQFSVHPDRGSSFPGAVAPGSTSKENQLICCDLGDGQTIETLAGLCLLPRGKQTADCTVCCNAVDDDFERVDHDACEPDFVVPPDMVLGDLCAEGCCDFGDREETHTAGECKALGGEPCVTVCCRVGGSAGLLTRVQCEQSGGIEVSPGVCVA